MPEQYYLQHWGIPKMQWGIRRYRNYDGTLTEEGKERYARRAERRAEIKAKIKNHFAEKRQRRKARKEVAKLYGGGKSVSEMTNDELNQYIERLTLEKKYSELLSKTHPDKLHAAQEFVTSLAARFVTKAATAGVDALVDKMYPKSKKGNGDNDGGNNNNGGGKKKKKGNNNNNNNNNSNNNGDDDWNPNQDLIDRRQRLGLESDVYRAKEKARESRYQYLEGERKRKEAERQRKEAEQDRKREWKRREQVARAQYKYRKKNGLSW